MPKAIWRRTEKFEFNPITNNGNPDSKEYSGDRAEQLEENRRQMQHPIV